MYDFGKRSLLFILVFTKRFDCVIFFMYAIRYIFSYSAGITRHEKMAEEFNSMIVRCRAVTIVAVVSSSLRRCLIQTPSKNYFSVFIFCVYFCKIFS